MLALHQKSGHRNYKSYECYCIAFLGLARLPIAAAMSRAVEAESIPGAWPVAAGLVAACLAAAGTARLPRCPRKTEIHEALRNLGLQLHDSPRSDFNMWSYAS